jgi:xanthine dehydrogenase accessory factor
VSRFSGPRQPAPGQIRSIITQMQTTGYVSGMIAPLDPPFPRWLVLIKGAGDLATGVALRLYRSGFPVVMTELAEPLTVRRGAAFGEAVFTGQQIVEGVVARLAPDAATAQQLLESGAIPVLVDPDAACRGALRPPVLLDAVMAKRNTGTTLADAPFVVSLGPGFVAGHDAHAVIETNRGHRLGRVIWQGAAEPDTGLPGEVGGKRSERVLHAPATGIVTATVEIGDMVSAGQLIARVDGHDIRAAFPGVLRGLVHPGVLVEEGMKVGDVDPRGERSHCFTASDKALAIGGGVLEAILARVSGRA